jgi:hypothetical protein
MAFSKVSSSMFIVVRIHMYMHDLDAHVNGYMDGAS